RGIQGRKAPAFACSLPQNLLQTPVPLMLRPPLRFLLSLCLGTTMLLSRARADSTLVFNEIMYHPATSETALEWIELHNQMGVNIDISGWSLAGGVQFQFTEGTVVPGRGYIV